MLHKCQNFEVHLSSTLAIEALLEEKSAVEFDGAPEPVTKQVWSVYSPFAKQPGRFEGLAKTFNSLRKAKALITLSNKDRFNNLMLDQLCGQRNHLPNRILRKCFMMLPEPVDMRNGIGYEFKINKEAIAELRVWLKSV